MPTTEIAREMLTDIPVPTSRDTVAVQIADRNIQKVLAVLMDPHNPQYNNNPSFRDGLATTLNQLVAQGVLPLDLINYPYDATSGMKLLTQMHVSLTLGEFDATFSHLPKNLRQMILDRYIFSQSAVQQ